MDNNNFLWLIAIGMVICGLLIIWLLPAIEKIGYILIRLPFLVGVGIAWIKDRLAG